MQTLFQTFHQMKCISANVFTLQGKNFFAGESEDNYYFYQQNQDKWDKIAEFSKNVEFVYNTGKTSVLAIERDRDNLKVTILPDKEVHLYKLSHEEEFVLWVTAGNNTLLLKTCQDISEDSQKNKVYFIDIESDTIMVCQDAVLNNSYHKPYIVTCNNREWIVAENAEIYPYELHEARSTLHPYKNDVLMAEVQEIFTTKSQKEELKWKVVCSGGDNSFLQVLYVDKYIWYLEKDNKETKSTIVMHDVCTGLDEVMLHINRRIDKAVFEKSTLICLYQWNSERDIIDIYNAKGDNLVKIDYSQLTRENETIELEDIISVLNERYVIFEATEEGNDAYYQCRVVYDITNEKFVIYSAPFIRCGDSIY